MDFESLSGIELDVLREVGNIGAGHAATVLSTMLGERVDMRVPMARLLSFPAVAEALGGDEALIAGVCLGVDGRAPGVILYALPLPAARYLVDCLLGRPRTDDETPGRGWAPEDFDAMDRSALEEVGNILTGAFLAALSDLAALDLHPTVPALAIDMAGAIIDNVLFEVGRSGDFALFVETTFLTRGREFRGQFFLIPDPESLPVILASLGVNGAWGRSEK